MKRDALRSFLKKQLPKDAPSDVTSLLKALHDAAQRYVRYAEYLRDHLKEERLPSPVDGWPEGWVRRRHRNLDAARKLSAELRHEILDIDPIFREDLDRHLGRGKVECVIGQLAEFEKHSKLLLATARITGRPRNLAQERWVLELAELYESQFGKSANPSARGQFYNLLKLSCPDKFVRHNFLEPIQIRRILERRSRLDAI